MASFVEFKNVSKTYHMGEVDIEALKDVNFVIEKGEFSKPSFAIASCHRIGGAHRCLPTGFSFLSA